VVVRVLVPRLEVRVQPSWLGVEEVTRAGEPGTVVRLLRTKPTASRTRSVTEVPAAEVVVVFRG
jgi:hypothetical protein